MSCSTPVLPGRRLGALGRSRPTAPTVVSLLVVALVAGGGVLVGVRAIDPHWAAASLAGGRRGLADLSVLPIVTRNVGAALLLYSGVATLGLTTLGGLVLTSVYVGATLSVGLHNSGVGALVGQTGSYAPLELVGLLLAAAAGLVPVVGALLGSRGPTRPAGAVRRYLDHVGPSLRLLGVGLVLIVLGAVVESLVLAAR